MNSWMTTIQWVFSGVGVVIVGGLATWVYRRFTKRARNQEDETPAQIISNSTIVGPVAGRDINIETFHAGKLEASESPDEYRAEPTPTQMSESIRSPNVSMYAKQSVADTYKDLKVRWPAILYSIRDLQDDRIDVVLLVGGVVVSTTVKLSDYPILKTVHGGEQVTVTGTIDYVQTNGPVHLREAKLRFL